MVQMKIANEPQARTAGLTREVIACSFHQELNLLVSPDSDFDSEFVAFDLDALETIKVKGWLGTFHDITPEQH